MKISIVTLKHYRRPRPGSKKGQPRGRIPSWEVFGKVCKEAWEAMFGLNDAPSLLKTGSNSPFCPPFPPNRKARPFKSLVEISNELHAMENRRTAAARHAREEELKAQALQEHNTKEVELAELGQAKHLLAEEMQASKELREQLAKVKGDHKKIQEHAKRLLDEREELRAQLTKANALNDSLSSQTVNLAFKTAELRKALESVEWQTVEVRVGFYSRAEVKCPMCKRFKDQGHEESCPIGKALTTL